MTLKIMPGAEPFYFHGGPVGCLCLHGLTASPQEMYWLGEYLADHGLTVYGPRLFGHGTRPDDILRARWSDWYLSALDGYHLLRRTCKRLYVMGLSMGGLLSLRIAAHEPVSGVIGLAAAYRLYPVNSWLTHLLRMAPVRVGKFDRAADAIDRRVREKQMARGEPLTGRVAYYEHTAAGVSELLLLQDEVGRCLENITAPVLLIDSVKDSVIPLEAADLIQAGLVRSPRVKRLRLNESDHILTNDVEDETVYRAVWGFIDKLEKSDETK